MATPGRADRGWCTAALRLLQQERDRCEETALRRFPLPTSWGVDLYVKDESAHPTGSLKHRLARSLFVHAVVNGLIGPGTTVIEASSGSTAISEAYFARLLGLRFIAVVPRCTSTRKLDAIRALDGECHLVDDVAQVRTESLRLASEPEGHFMDQFANAERVTDWRSESMAAAALTQLSTERHPIPRWVVVGAGTGGTSAMFARHLRFRALPTEVAVVDPEGSALLDVWRTGDTTVRAPGSRIEGIGRPGAERSFIPTLIDRMIRVPDAASVAATRLLRTETGLDAGGSTGTNLYGALALVAEMVRSGERGSVLTLMCDAGERYRDMYECRTWLTRHQIDPAWHLSALHEFLATGDWPSATPPVTPAPALVPAVL